MVDLPTSAEPKARLKHREAWVFWLWCVYQLTLCFMTETDRVDHQWGLLNNRGHDDDSR